jgi:hypothetical protein
MILGGSGFQLQKKQKPLRDRAISRSRYAVSADNQACAGVRLRMADERQSMLLLSLARAAPLAINLPNFTSIRHFIAAQRRGFPLRIRMEI